MGPIPDRSGGVLPGYGGSKAALEHLTQCAAFDLAGYNIAVNALSPSKPIMTPGLSYYATDFVDTAPAEEFAEAAVRAGAGGRGCGHRTHDRSSPGARRQLPAVHARQRGDLTGEDKFSGPTDIVFEISDLAGQANIKLPLLGSPELAGHRPRCHRGVP